MSLVIVNKSLAVLNIALGEHKISHIILNHGFKLPKKTKRVFPPPSQPIPLSRHLRLTPQFIFKLFYKRQMHFSASFSIKLSPNKCKKNHPLSNDPTPSFSFQNFLKNSKRVYSLNRKNSSINSVILHNI